MPRRFRVDGLAATITATLAALVLASCSGGASAKSEASTPTEQSASARADVAPEISAAGYMSPRAWMFNEYANGVASEFDIPDGEVLCALHGDYAVTTNRHNRTVHGYYLPTHERAWLLDESTCATNGFVPQPIAEGVVVAAAARDDHAAALADFATGETILDIPVIVTGSPAAPIPLGMSGEILVLTNQGSIYGVNDAGELRWELPAQGWTWSTNFMTGHVFGLKDREEVMVVNGVTGEVVVDTTVPRGRPITPASGGFMYQAEAGEPFTFVTLDGTVSHLEAGFTGAQFVPTTASGAVFPLNLYLSPNAGPVFDASGNSASFDIDLDSFQRDGAGNEPVVVAVSADGKHAVVDDRGGTIYLVTQGGQMVWHLDALRPRIVGSYLVADFGVGDERIVIPRFEPSPGAPAHDAHVATVIMRDRNLAPTTCPVHFDS